MHCTESYGGVSITWMQALQVLNTFQHRVYSRQLETVLEAAGRDADSETPSSRPQGACLGAFALSGKWSSVTFAMLGDLRGHLTAAWIGRTAADATAAAFVAAGPLQQTVAAASPRGPTAAEAKSRADTAGGACLRLFLLWSGNVASVTGLGGICLAGLVLCALGGRMLA